MLILVPHAECDGCRTRVEGPEPPDTWSTVYRNGRPEQWFCSSLCHAGHDGVEPETVYQARARGLHLSPHDILLLEGIARGLSNDEIALELQLARPSVKNRLTVVFRALHVQDRTQAVLVAGHLGLINLAAFGAEIRRTS